MIYRLGTNEELFVLGKCAQSDLWQVLAVLSTEYFGDCSASRCARMGAFGTYNKQTTTQCSAQERHQLNCTVRCSMCVPSTFFICLLKRHTQICKQSDGQSQKRAPRTKHRGGRKVRGFCRESVLKMLRVMCSHTRLRRSSRRPCEVSTQQPTTRTVASWRGPPARFTLMCYVSLSEVRGTKVLRVTC
jgi:hypothetical protein